MPDITSQTIAFVAKHRKRLAQEAQRETEKKHDRMLALVNELEEMRTELIALRETTVWAELYPSEHLYVRTRPVWSSQAGAGA